MKVQHSKLQKPEGMGDGRGLFGLRGKSAYWSQLQEMLDGMDDDHWSSELYNLRGRTMSQTSSPQTFFLAEHKGMCYFSNIHLSTPPPFKLFRMLIVSLSPAARTPGRLMGSIKKKSRTGFGLRKKGMKGTWNSSIYPMAHGFLSVALGPGLSFSSLGPGLCSLRGFAMVGRVTEVGTLISFKVSSST